MRSGAIGGIDGWLGNKGKNAVGRLHRIVFVAASDDLSVKSEWWPWW